MVVGVGKDLVKLRRWRVASMLGAAGAVVAVAFAVPAHAAQSAKLVYSRGPGTQACPAEAGLRRSVAKRLGYDPFVAVSNRTVVAEIRSEVRGLAARVYVIVDDGTSGGARQLTTDDRDCSELLAAVALAISIAIDPEAMDRIASNESTSTQPNDVTAEPAERSLPVTAPPVIAAEPQRPQPAVVAADEPEKSPRAAEAAKLRRQLSGFVSIANGPVPAPALALGFGFGLSKGHVGLLLEPTLLLPSTSHDGSASVRAYGYGTSAGLGLRVGNWFIGIVGDFDLLVSRGQVAFPRTDRSWMIAVGPRLALMQPVAKHWFFGIGVDVSTPIRTVELQVDGQLAYAAPNPMLRGRVSMHYEW